MLNGIKISQAFIYVPQNPNKTSQKATLNTLKLFTLGPFI